MKKRIPEPSPGLFLTLLVIAIFLILLIMISKAFSHNDGRYTNSLLKPWFDNLASKKGLCCSFTDGLHIDDVDWDVKNGQYWVQLDGNWIPVPEAALITEPNRYGQTVVWPYRDPDNTIQIRCFMPGAGG